MTALESLLAVQEHDSAADRIRHRLAQLPERAALAEARARAREVEARLAERREELALVARDEHRLEGEAEVVGTKARAVDQRLYSGEVSAVKELQALQADLDQLRRQRATIEDEELEVMVQREELEAAVAALDDDARAEADRIGELEASLADQQSQLEAELAGEERERAAAAALVPADLLAVYEHVRARHDGVGAARLVGDTCQGCRLSLPTVDVARIRALAPDDLAQCEHCEAVLVRT